MDQKKIGSFIGEARKKKALTQEQLGEMLGVSQRTVSRWETGKNMPDLSMLSPLCDALDIHIAEFLAGEKKEGESFTREEVSGLLPGFAELVRQKEKRRRLAGALLSLLLTLVCMFALYNYAFPIDVSSTGNLERAIEEYHFDREIHVDVLERTALRDRLFVLYGNRDRAGASGLAQLQRGIFGKYRMISARDYNYPLCLGEMVEVGGTDYLLVFCANELPGVEKFAYYELDGDWNDTGGLVYSAEIAHFPFLYAAELAEKRPISPFLAHYYDARGEEISAKALEALFDTDGAAAGGIGTAELGTVYFLESVILALGVLFARYFRRDEA